jgi:hypothetical protein
LNSRLYFMFIHRSRIQPQSRQMIDRMPDCHEAWLLYFLCRWTIKSKYGPLATRDGETDEEDWRRKHFML